jgi:hypothetical protein
MLNACAFSLHPTSATLNNPPLLRVGDRMFKFTKIVIVVVSSVAIAGCASSSNDIKASYVSPMQYQSYNCQQISAEAERISRRVSETSGVQDSKASNDAVVTGVALVLFWPAAFMMKGDGQTAAELARLKGEFEALERASIEKSCGLKFQQKQAVKS